VEVSPRRADRYQSTAKHLSNRLGHSEQQVDPQSGGPRLVVDHLESIEVQETKPQTNGLFRRFRVF